MTAPPVAMILCAGLGTRLRPLTLELPKPLVPVGDRPLLGHIGQCLRAAGIARAVVNTHHLPDKFSNAGEILGLEVKLMHEPEIRGTAGGLAGARAAVGAAPILLWNGDILCEPPIPELLGAAEAGGLVLAVAPRERGEGTVGVDSAGRVVRLRGRVFGVEERGGDYIGVAGVGARCLESLPEVGCLVGDWALPELERGTEIRVAFAEGGFSDAGDLASYLALNLEWLARAGLGSWTGEGAEVESRVRLERAVIGARARVNGRGVLERCVVWPGASATAPLRDAIVTSGGRVVRLG